MPTILELPDIRQIADYDCGQAASEIVLAHLGYTFGLKIPITSIDGADPRTIESAFRQMGLPVISGQMDPGLLRYFADTGRPVICLIQHNGVGHYVVSAGVLRGSIHYQCPVEGLLTVKINEFLDIWHDTDRFGTNFTCFGIAIGG